MSFLEEITIKEREIGYCLVPSKHINETNIENTEEYEIGVYIPKLMSEVTMGNKPETKEEHNILSDMIINKNFPIRFSNKIKLSNFIRVKPYTVSNISTPIISPGEKMYIVFTNNDITKPYYTTEMTDENSRERDLQVITCNTMKDDVKKTYKITMNGLDNFIRIELSDEVFIDINDNSNEINIKNHNTSIKMTDNNVDIQGEFSINGRNIEKIITDIHNSLGRGGERDDN